MCFDVVRWRVDRNGGGVERLDALDEIGRSLRDHDGGRVQVAARHARHHGGINDV